jgi:hypothetical protein
MSDRLEPGDLVRLDGRPDWGLGQVQSVIGLRATVNFEHGGKQLINLALARLVIEAGDPRAEA